MSQCPPGRFPPPAGSCQACHSSCLECYGASSLQCSRCGPGLFLSAETSQCVSECPPGTRQEEQSRACVDCPRHCERCGGGECEQCQERRVLAGGECLVRCPPGQYEQSGSCSPCHSSCHSCVGPLDTDCARCSGKSLYFERRCVPYCPAGYTPDSAGAECLPCPLGCDSCTSPAQCVTCSPGWSSSSDGLCSPPQSQRCQPGLYWEAGTCLACHAQCRTCWGRAEDCTTCYPDTKQLLSSCSEDCPAGSYMSRPGAVCVNCPHSCQSCDGHSCDSCQPRYFLQVRSFQLVISLKCNYTPPGRRLCGGM